MGLSLENDFNYVILFDKGNLDIEMKYLSFQNLDEILENFSDFLVRLEYQPVIGEIYTDIFLPFKLENKNNRLEEIIFSVERGYFVLKKVGDPSDNVVVRGKTFYNIPMFLEKIKDNSYTLRFFLDEEAIAHYIFHKKVEIFDILRFPITTISIDYFYKSDLKSTKIENIYFYPTIIEVKNQEDFLNILSKAINESYKNPSYII
ncbi:MAG: hypothetical protein QXY16_01660 [Nanopusillaceae archaeon]